MGLYYTFKFLELVLKFAPKSLSYAIADILAALAFRGLLSLRRTVTGNIVRVLDSSVDKSTVNRTARRVIASTLKNYFDMVRMQHLSQHELLNSIQITGLNHLDAAVAKGNGVILFTAHLGCFDTAFQAFSTYPTQVTVVVEPITPPLVMEYVSTLRSKFGVNILPAKSGALKPIMKLLRSGEILLFVLDRDTAGARVQSSFFGHTTSMPAEAIKIAMRTGAAVVPVFNNRRSDGKYNVYIEPEVDMMRNGNGSLEHNMAQVARVMEKYIRRFPEQWVVMKPIWES